MDERELSLERLDRWRRRAGALPGKSWSKSVAENIRGGARLREELYERGIAAARGVLRNYHATKPSLPPIDGQDQAATP